MKVRLICPLIEILDHPCDLATLLARCVRHKGGLGN